MSRDAITPKRRILASVAGLIVAASTPAHAESPSIVSRMGMAMPEAQARHAIAFRPFAPPREVDTVALLPPFHGDDVRANRGIGFAYRDAEMHRYALAEWPRNGGSIDQFPPLAFAPESNCPNARSFSRGTGQSGIVWSTPRGLVMTLQFEGTDAAGTLQAEWRRLIRRGACR